jgi:hypothetical protein
MKCNRKIFQMTVMLVILAFLAISSTVFSFEIKPLKRDKISPKCQSVIFGRLRVLSAIPNFRPLANEFVFSLFNEDNQSRDLRIVFKSKYIVKPEDGVRGYDVPFYAEVEAGDYSFRRYKYTFSNVNLGDLSLNGGGYLYGINGGMWNSCSIPAERLIYLGVIAIQYNEIIVTPDNNLKVDADFNISFDDYETDLSNFQKTYPKLYERFEDTVMEADWSF